jgi:hypothetical protein
MDFDFTPEDEAFRAQLLGANTVVASRTVQLAEESLLARVVVDIGLVRFADSVERAVVALVSHTRTT